MRGINSLHISKSAQLYVPSSLPTGTLIDLAVTELAVQFKNKKLQFMILDFNPSEWGYLKPSQYCDVGRFLYGYLNFELNCSRVYSK